jgi:integrase
MLADTGRRCKQKHDLHMTLEEWKIIMQHVRDNKSLKWYTFLSLLSFRGMRPAEACAVNILDFSDNFTKLTYREAKTNRLRLNEPLIPDLAKLIKTYIVLNRHMLVDGYLFPYYKKKSKGKPYMSRDSASAWFCEIREDIKQKYPGFDEHYFINTQMGIQKRYRVNLYSFRRFFETQIYRKNGRDVALIKEIMEYSSKFDPIPHYIKAVDSEANKYEAIENTFKELAGETIQVKW